MAFNLGEKLKALWQLQPWYLWLGEGGAVGAIAYVAWSSRQQSSAQNVSAADTTVTDPSLATPPGEAPGPGGSPGVPPPSGTLPPTPIPPSPILPPGQVGSPPGVTPGGSFSPSGPGGPGVPAQPIPRQPLAGKGGGGVTHPFAGIEWPSEWHERIAEHIGHTGLPFHTAGEY